MKVTWWWLWWQDSYLAWKQNLILFNINNSYWTWLANEEWLFGSMVTLKNMNQNPIPLWSLWGAACEEHFSGGWGTNLKPALQHFGLFISITLSLSLPTLPFSNDFTSVMVSASLPCHARAHEWITRISRSWQHHLGACLIPIVEASGCPQAPNVHIATLLLITN